MMNTDDMDKDRSEFIHVFTIVYGGLTGMSRKKAEAAALEYLSWASLECSTIGFGVGSVADWARFVARETYSSYEEKK
jgi:hypothetical protein